MRRWGLTTLFLEQHSGHIDQAILRRVLRDQAEAVCPVDTPGCELETACSFLARIGPHHDSLPVAWCCFGSPADGIWLPTLPLATAADEADGRESLPWRRLASWRDESRRSPRLRDERRAEQAELQQQLDELTQDFLAEADRLHRQHEVAPLHRLADSLMQHCCERIEELAGGREHAGELVLQGADF
jgi:hypothetical protein